MSESSQVISLLDQLRERALTEDLLIKATQISQLEDTMVRAYCRKAEGDYNGWKYPNY